MRGGRCGFFVLYLFNMNAEEETDMSASMPDLFGYAVAPIDGLSSVADFIDVDAERALLARVDAGVWNTAWQRRTQHYGLRYYDPAERCDATEPPAVPLPDWLAPLCRRLFAEGHCDVLPDRVSVNEYLPGQGIAPHIDAGLDLVKTIMIVSLGSPCVMEFSHPRDGRKVCRLLERRSLTVIDGEARRDWRHGIPKRRSDLWQGAKIMRTRRVSLMFRSVFASSRPI